MVDHSRVNDELGGAEAHARMCAALEAAGLGQVLDIVPNHMAVTAGNAWWWDVLENGPSSQYASYFDVDWDPPEAKLRNTVLLPVLGDHYGRVLEAGEIQLDGVRAALHGPLLRARLAGGSPVARRPAGRGRRRRAARAELAFLADAFGRLPSERPPTGSQRAGTPPGQGGARPTRWPAWSMRNRRWPPTIDAEVARLNADVDALDALLERQNYRLAFWRTAGRELDYRRFFDIHTLVGLRVEDENVFADTHELVLGWLADGVLDGLRIDHPDGLRDPEGYLRRLRELRPRRLGGGREDPGAGRAAARRPGRWRGPPATTSPTGSPACSSTRRGRSRSPPPTPPSPAATRPGPEVGVEQEAPGDAARSWPPRSTG